LKLLWAVRTLVSPLFAGLRREDALDERELALKDRKLQAVGTPAIAVMRRTANRGGATRFMVTSSIQQQ